MKTHGAGAVIISGNKILLFHRDDIPTIPLPNTWALPGGMIEDGESPLEALQRELFEEVTYVPSNLTPLGLYENKNGNNYIFVSFVSGDEENKFQHKPDEGQGIAFFTLDDAYLINLTPPLRWFLENKRQEIEKMMKTQQLPDPEVFKMKKIDRDKWT